VGEPVQTELRDGVLLVTLNRPEKKNALDGPMFAALEEAGESLKQDKSVRAVVLSGEGRAFCAGLDLKELGGETDGASDAGRAISGGGNLVQAIEGLAVPIIGAINGVAITGGFELALACDVLIASTNARFADTHARVGVLPGWGLSQKLPRLIGVYRAKELSLTGNFIDAEQAERWGLVNRVVEPDALLPVCEELAHDMLSCDPRTLRTYKRVVDDGYATSFGEGLRLESAAYKEHLKGVTAQAVGARRAEIQNRGRQQSKSRLFGANIRGEREGLI